MIYVDKTTEQWCQKYGLKVMERSCDNCGSVMRTTKPFLEKGYAGLKAPNCACGKNRFTASVIVTISKEAHQDWALFGL